MSSDPVLHGGQRVRITIETTLADVRYHRDAAPGRAVVRYADDGEHVPFILEIPPYDVREDSDTYVHVEVLSR